MDVTRAGSLPNEERIIERIAELNEYLSNFPDGLLADFARNEIAQLEKVQEEYFI